MSEIKKLKLNTIIYFHADYIDDDGEPAKGRRHLVVELDQKNDQVFLLKITSKRKDLYQVIIGLTSCLDKFSHSNLNRKLSFRISSLKDSNYENFYICPFHTSGCLEKELFKKVRNKLQKYWNSKFKRDKKEVPLDDKLRVPKNFPSEWRKFYLQFNPEFKE